MRPLEDFLEKIKKTILRGQILKDDIVRIIKKETGIEVPVNEITVSNKKIKISSYPAIKNEIFLKKSFILSGLKERGIYIDGIF